jgi:uncharacterized protein YkwD
VRTPADLRRPPAAVIATLLCALGFAPGTAGAEDCPGAGALPSASTPDGYSRATLCLVNEERLAQGRRRLRVDAQLAAAAGAYAEEIVATGVFAHRSAGGESVVNRVGGQPGGLDRWIVLGENLGWGSLDLATPRELVRGWMRSSTHRANVLRRRFTHLGVGVVFAAPGDPARPEAATYASAFGALDRRSLRRRR